MKRDYLIILALLMFILIISSPICKPLDYIEESLNYNGETHTYFKRTYCNGEITEVIING